MPYADRKFSMLSRQPENDHDHDFEDLESINGTNSASDRGTPLLPKMLAKEGKRDRIGNFYDNVILRIKHYITIQNETLRAFLAEVFGTFLFISFSLASVAQFVFSDKNLFISVNLSFGFGLTMAIIAVGKVSGAHLNPAVSLSMFLLRQLSLVQFIVYIIAQFTGAFLAAVFVYLTYYSSLKGYKNGMHSLDTAGIFATYPYDANTGTRSSDTFSLFFDQYFATSLFMITILAITDKQNTDIAHEGVAVLIGFSLTVIGTSFGHNCGFAVNPARDFAPRVFTAMAGWGSLPFTAGGSFFWIPLLAPMLGSVSGTILYSLFISNHWPDYA